MMYLNCTYLWPQIKGCPIASLTDISAPTTPVLPQTRVRIGVMGIANVNVEGTALIYSFAYMLPKGCIPWAKQRPESDIV